MNYQMSLFDGQQPLQVNKPIRLIELFAGIGAQAKALTNLGVPFEHYRICEFDKYAVKSYNAIHGTDFKTSDITQITADDLGIVDTDKYAYILTYSFPCFTADSLILTDKGFKPIVEIKSGDMVLTHDNSYQKVVNTFDNGVKPLLRINAMAVDEIKCTPNHRFYIRTMRHKGHEWKRVFDSPCWKSASDLTKSDYLGVAINQKSIIHEWNGVDYTWADGRKTRHKNTIAEMQKYYGFWWIIGRYIGDGWMRTQGGIIICCAYDELDELERQIGKFYNYSVSKERTACKVHIPDKELSEFVSQFGKGAANKHLTNTIIDLPRELLKGFLDGYMSADGYVAKGRYEASSVSRELIYGLAQCVAKVYRTPYRVYFVKRRKTCVIEGRQVNQRNQWELAWKVEKCKQDKAFYEDGYIWFPIRTIEQIESQNVYDIEVENNHSFTVQNTIVHNCTDLSKAGQQKGMAKGSGTRSGLLWEVERLLTECKELPQILLMENVPDVIGKKNIKHFADWVAFLDSIGYETRWEVLNAKDYGIPQNRDRCFAISWLKSMGNCYYAFPPRMKLNNCLADVLQRTVLPKYYLSEKAVRSFMISMHKQQAKGNNFKFEPTTGGGTAKSVLTRSGSRPCDNFIVETGDAVRKDDRLRSDHNGERLQGLRQSSNDSGGRKNAHGVMLGTSDRYNAGLLKDLSRTITTEGKNGVVEWKK